MSRAARSLRPLIGIGALGATSYVVYKYYQKPAPPQTFEISTRQRMTDGSVMRVPLTLPMIPVHEVDERLRKHEIIGPKLASGWRLATAHIRSNDPIEDAHAHAVVKPVSADESATKADSETLMAAVFDGHAGFETSRLLAKTMLPAVGLELHSLKEAIPSNSKSTDSPGFATYLKSWVSTPPQAPAGSTHASSTFDANPAYVSMALKTAFARLDSEIVGSPYRLLSPLFAADPKATLDLDKHPLALASLLPALSGSCALVTFLDPGNNHLHVAVTGDSRAVAGLSDSAPGSKKWVVDVLTEDQTGRNPSELQRIQSEHPAEERDFVIQRGRILGGLEPSRAFGDSRYKWPVDFQMQLARALAGSELKLRRPPSDLKSPPYVTSEPVTSHRSLKTGTSFDGKPDVRFIVLATDGLWDELSNAEVVCLTGAHLNGRRGLVSKAELAQTVVQGQNTGVNGKQSPGDSADYAPGERWDFADENVATHLLRNAIGKGDALRLRKSLSIPAPHSRRFRDDITVTVLWWEDPSLPSPQEQPVPVKARL